MKVKQKDKKDKRKDNTPWDEAIKHAEGMIREARAQIAGLRESIRVFNARRDEGVPWPGPDSATPN